MKVYITMKIDRESTGDGVGLPIAVYKSEDAAKAAVAKHDKAYADIFREYDSNACFSWEKWEKTEEYEKLWAVVNHGEETYIEMEVIE